MIECLSVTGQILEIVGLVSILLIAFVIVTYAIDRWLP